MIEIVKELYMDMQYTKTQVVKTLHFLTRANTFNKIVWLVYGLYTLTTHNQNVNVTLLCRRCIK